MGEVGERVPGIDQSLTTEKPSILLTGFEGWGSITTNPSQVIVESIAKKHPMLCSEKVRLCVVILPVDWVAAARKLRECIDGIKPIAVVSVGLAQGISALHIERVAINLCNGKDNAGVMKNDCLILEGGESSLMTTLPSRVLQQRIQLSGVPCELSYSAGTFLCNYVMYNALQISKERRETNVDTFPLMAGFIHVPLLPMHAALQSRHVQPSMDANTAATGIHAALENICETYFQREEA